MTSLDVQGQVQGTSIFFSIQGNILARAEVVQEAVKAFRDAAGALTDRVMAATEAADRNGGDSRCSCDRGPKIDVRNPRQTPSRTPHSRSGSQQKYRTPITGQDRWIAPPQQ